MTAASVVTLARADKALTVEQLAVEAGVDTSLVYRIEARSVRRPSVLGVARIARVLELRPSEIVADLEAHRPRASA